MELLDESLAALKIGVGSLSTRTHHQPLWPFLELGSREVTSLRSVFIGGQWLGTKAHHPRKL